MRSFWRWPWGERALEPLAAYTLWAPAYGDEPQNALMRLEQDAVLDLAPPLAGATVLDLACGAGRYLKRLHAAGATCVVGLDLTPAMLARARSFPGRLLRGDMTLLPLADSSFDFVLCGLAVGHVAALSGFLREVARVLRPGGAVVYSDVHPEAAHAGWTRTFRGPDGRWHTVLHHVHEPGEHRAACAAAGLAIEDVREPRVDFAHPWEGRPAVLALRARRPPLVQTARAR